MTFSQQPPTAPGLYWYKLIEVSNVHHCQVFFVGKALCATGSDGYKPVDQFRRWWSVDFLPEPEQR